MVSAGFVDKMRQKRFQNKMAESRFSLAATGFLCLIIWICCGLPFTPEGWLWTNLSGTSAFAGIPNVFVTLPCLLIATYLMVELNNSNSLIRIFSRMVSCVFLVLITMVTFHLASVKSSVVTLCAVAFLTAMFHCYQDRDATGMIYHAFICIGIASLLFVHILFFLPLLWVLMASKLLCMSHKTFLASIFGTITPYWLLAAYHLPAGNFQNILDHFAELAHFTPVFNYSMLNEHQIVTAIYIIAVAMIGIVHYLRKRQQDHIRTQMLYELLIIIDIAAITFLILQPQHYESLLGIIIVNTSPIIAHFIALTQTRWTNLMTKLLMLLAMAVTIYNLWMPSLIF